MTFVALDKNGKAIAIPPLILETPEEQRRNREAQARRETRLREKTKEKACQLVAENCDCFVIGVDAACLDLLCSACMKAMACGRPQADGAI